MPNGGGGLIGHYEEEAKQWREEAKRLKKTIKKKDKQIERMGFCPDCRDKLDGKCYRCKLQTVQVIASTAKQLIDSVAEIGQDWKKYGLKEVVETLEKAVNLLEKASRIS